MKCKNCGEEINLVIFGCPEDLCWNCIQEIERKIVLDQNIEFAKSKREEEK